MVEVALHLNYYSVVEKSLGRLVKEFVVDDVADGLQDV